jgi:citrate lyase subunit gamma (acyl carrier protein)
MHLATCGTFESNDCYVTVMPHEVGRSIQIESIVFASFGAKIQSLIEEILDEHHLNNIAIAIQDKGALDYTIRARVLTAIQRAGIAL